jgi:hypothetical protein
MRRRCWLPNSSSIHPADASQLPQNESGHASKRPPKRWVWRESDVVDLPSIAPRLIKSLMCVGRNDCFDPS